MRKTKLTACVNTYDIWGNVSETHFPVYVENERLFIKVQGEHIYIYSPDLLKNNIRILEDKTK